MSHVTLKGKEIALEGNFIKKGQKAPPFTLVDISLKKRHLEEFKGKKKLISTVPSLDTEVCLLSTKILNEAAKKRADVVFLIVSADLPFAQKRVCGLEKLDNVIPLSMMHDKNFGKDYGVLIKEGVLQGLCARSLVVLDEQDKILYAELVGEISQEPTYENALAYLK
ncbi:MAG: thiol peroxidase [Chlamydiae bacterium]|nr:thiol peroxidase [Chlamydiota bacterium]